MVVKRSQNLHYDGEADIEELEGEGQKEQVDMLGIKQERKNVRKGGFSFCP